MPKKFGSLFLVRKEVARRGALNAIQSIEEKRQEFFEEEVSKVMRRRFFRLKTREEAEEAVQRGSDQVPKWRCYAWGDLERAKEICGACEISEGDFVYLDREDAAFIRKHTETSLKSSMQ